MNLRSLVASLFGGGGRPKVHVWKRFEPLGEGIAGTMSRFFKVRDSESGQIVGLKLPDTAKLAPIEARFKGLNKPSEGEISSQIKGDHIVVTHEFGRTHDGGQYLVQEFLEGSLVHLRLKRGDPLSLPERIDIIRQAASALAVVHEAGFVHRDICPRNLMLSPKGRVTLFDFGLSVPDAPPFLRPGNRTGTPNYMAPEVIRRRQCSRQLDIFSFGVTAYEICCGLLPWPGGNARAALAHDTPPPDIRERNSDIPASLAGAIMDCLRAEPEERPESFRVFLGRIARL